MAPVTDHFTTNSTVVTSFSQGRFVKKAGHVLYAAKEFATFNAAAVMATELVP